MRIKEQIEKLIKMGITDFLTGGAIGFDTIAALCVLELKQRYSIRLILMLPCKTQTEGWTSQKNINTYNTILSKADSVNYISESYDKSCMFIRNRALVDNSDFCIAYCNKDSGGTAYTVKYASEKGITVINLAK